MSVFEDIFRKSPNSLPSRWREENLEVKERFNKKGKRVSKWTERDLNPRLPRCERGDHTRLIYRPRVVQKRLRDGI